MGEGRHDPACRPLKVGTATPNNGYGYQTWITHRTEPRFAALGVHGQAIYVDPVRKLVVVHTAAWADGDDRAARGAQFSTLRKHPENAMTYVAKPRLHHPTLPKNKLGFTRRDYEGKVSTLCAGCGHDSISAALIQAFWELDIQPHRVAKLSGIGCSSKTPDYFLGNSHGFNTVHGRMPSVLTGANLANRELMYLGVSGDGDSASIGLGQFAHVMRRGVNMTYILENNGVYGLTKGQFSATADKGSKAKKGATNKDSAIDTVSLALLMGATFVARSFSATSTSSSRWSRPPSPTRAPPSSTSSAPASPSITTPAPPRATTTSASTTKPSTASTSGPPAKPSARLRRRRSHRSPRRRRRRHPQAPQAHRRLRRHRQGRRHDPLARERRRRAKC